MTTILVLESSTGGDSSVSKLLVRDALDRLRTADKESRVLHHDFGLYPIPHLTTSSIAGVRGEPVTEEERLTRALSDQLIAELKAANIILVGAPMYNFGISTALRAWFDHVLRAGQTFSYSESGPKGLLQGKRALVVEARGGHYSEGPAQALDFQEPYLRQLFGFMGVTDVTFVRAEKIGFGPDARSQAIEGATARIADVIPHLRPEAA
ncbi:FMN-dependent NADH-azoreductase [Indioceanicola profundi]|uniref:FMN-dependent NADH-azoreductase n=1 Tax=Indioceanicola profundi TaxID=2220096 RepID=UPI000E6AA93C|nr:FMN-dependent NADH-azoreductase [Indioceanicola profundi]